MSTGINAYRKITTELLALLHCNDAYFRQQPVPAINSVPGGSTFTPYGSDFYGWFTDTPPLSAASPGSYSTGDEAAVLHSNTKFAFPGQFCLEGFFQPLGWGGTVMEIADGNGSSGNRSGVSFIGFQSYAIGEDATYMYLRTEIWGKTVGGTAVTIATGDEWLMDKNDQDTISHVAFYRDAANYVYVAMGGVLRAKSSAPFPGVINGYVNLAGGYDQNTGEITKGGHRIKITEFRVIRGASVYGQPPFTPPSTRFTLS